MAGTAMIPMYSGSVRIDFVRPYALTPKIIVTPSDYVMYRVVDKSNT